MKPFSVLYMQRALALILCLSPGVFVASPLTADDLYGAPDPGWYNQGSGWSAGPDSGWSDSGYGAQVPAAPYGGSGFGDSRQGSGAYGYESGYQYGQDSGYGENWSRWEDRRGDAPAVEPVPDYERPDGRRATQDRRPAPTSPNGYGAPDWAQRRDSDLPGQDVYRRDSAPTDVYTDYRFRDKPARRQTWPDRGASPRYRFRDDPSIEQQYRGDSGGDFRFRPLTQRERQRTADTDPRFVDPDRDRRSGRSQAPERGSAFGYEPDVPKDDFYRRYYRSGP